MKVSLIIPTYRRPQMLEECVKSVLGGVLRADEIIIVGRKGDSETEQMVTKLQAYYGSETSIKEAWVSVPGHIPPVEAGIKSASGEVVAIIDDDVTVTPHWLERIVDLFADPQMDVVGGRIIVPGQRPPKLKGKPGQVTWYGKHWGNIGSVSCSAPFEVASVMECNWAWRRKLIASLEFDNALNFDDASMYGMDLCFQARERGSKLLYDPQMIVYHHVAPRAPELDRADRPRRLFAYCRNYTYIMLKHLPWGRKIAFIAWWFLIGERGAWGVGAIAVDTLLGRFRWRREAGSAFLGKIEGIRLWLHQRNNHTFREMVLPSIF